MNGKFFLKSVNTNWEFDHPLNPNFLRSKGWHFDQAAEGLIFIGLFVMPVAANLACIGSIFGLEVFPACQLGVHRPLLVRYQAMMQEYHSCGPAVL